MEVQLSLVRKCVGAVSVCVGGGCPWVISCPVSCPSLTYSSLPLPHFYPVIILLHSL